MIGRLRGTIVEEDADGTLILEVGGVGYEVLAPLGTLGRLRKDDAGLVTVHVHTHAREDALILYGFAAREDRALFRTLIGISNVGPKLAMGILGALSAGELAQLVVAGDSRALTRIPGVGKKTAERLVLELKDKLLAPTDAATAVPTANRPAGPPSGTNAAMLHQALTRMGYRPAEADRALSTLGERIANEPLGELVREALSLLSR